MKGFIPPGATPATLRARGRRVGSVLSSVAWIPAVTDSEHQAVFDLRTLAYQRAGKYAPDAAEPMRDAYDDDALHLAAWFDGHPVAAVRLMCHPEGSTWEHEQYVSLNHPEVPPKAQTVEITRVCVHPEWAGTDLVVGLIQEAAISVLRLGRRFLVGCATRQLMGLYARVGCAPTSITFRHCGVGGAEHIVFTADVRGDLPRGGHNRMGQLSPLVWAIVWAPVYRRAIAEELIDPPGMPDAARLWLLCSLRPTIAAAHELARRRSRMRRPVQHAAQTDPKNAHLR